VTNQASPDKVHNNDSYLRANWLPGNARQQGALSVALSAALWGLFWIPLRLLDDHGVNGVSAVALVMLAGVVPSIIVLVRANNLNSLKSVYPWFIGSALGMSIVLYFVGVIISDVIRVIFLFYLLPIWTTLAARVIYNEPITRLRLFIIVMALIGLWLLLGGGSKLPIPNHVGDWCGLLAGVCWGVSLAIIHGKDGIDASTMVCTTTISSSIIAIVAALLLLNTGNTELVSIVQVNSWLLVIAITLGFAFLMLFPALIGQIWGAQRIAAPTAALLTMSEVLVATVSAYLLIGTELNTVSMIGATIILVAVLIDIAVKFKQQEQ